MRQLVVATGWLLLAHPALGWQVTWPGEGHAIALDEHGGVVVAGARTVGQQDGGPITSFEVDSLTGSGGRRWHFDGGLGSAAAVAVDPAGNVLAGGELVGGAYPPTVTVLELDGVQGQKTWQAALASGSLDSMAVTSGGDVIASLRVLDHSTGAYAQYDIFKLAGATGAVEWQKALPLEDPDQDGRSTLALDGKDGVILCAGSIVVSLGGYGAERWRIAGFGNAVAFDPGGDVFVTGRRGFSDPSGVRRLAAADGSERWQAVLPGVFALPAVVVDPAGNVLVGGERVVDELHSVFWVAKLDSATRRERWHRRIGTRAEDHSAPRVLALDGARNVIAAGRVARSGSRPVYSFAIASLAARTGAVRWRTFVSRTSGLSYDGASGVVIDRGGHAIAIGTVGTVDLVDENLVRPAARVPTDPRAVVVRLSRR